MAEPTSYLSMLELCTDIAQDAGTAYRGPAGTSRTMLPIDKDDLADIVKVVNDGVRMFIADAPPTGWKWPKRIMSVNVDGTRVTGTADGATAATFYDAVLALTYKIDNGPLVGMYVYVLTGTGAGNWSKILNYDATSVPGTIGVVEWLDVNGNPTDVIPAIGDTYAITKYETIGGDIARYPLAENFGGEISGQITYEKDASHTQRVTWVPESEIRLKRQLGDSAGYPYLAAIRQVEPVSSSPGPKRRYELLLWPDPSQDDVLEFPYPLIFDKLDIESGITTSVTAGSYILADSTREETNDYFNGWLLTIIGGTGKGQSAVVHDYAAGSFTFLVGTWFTTDPDTTSVYVVEPVNNLHPAGIKFDNVVKSACLAKAEMKFPNFTSGHVEEYIQKDLPKAYQADARSVMHTKIGKKPPYKRVWKDVEKI